MKKKMIKNLMLVVVMVVLCFAVGMTASAERAVVDSGKCGANGDNVIWTLYDDGEMVISGEGELYYEQFSWGNSTTIASYKDEIKKLTIEEGITKLGYAAFSSCKNITEVSLPNGLTVLDSCAFSGCKNITKISLPDSLIAIGDEVLNTASDLEIFIPATVEYIGAYPFLLIKKITVDEDNQYYSSDDKGVLFNKEKTELITFPSNADIAEYAVPEGVERIRLTAQYVQNLTKISFPSSLKTIDEGCFAYSPKLKTVEFSEGLETIGELAFAASWSIESITLPSTLKNIGEYAFGQCNGLKEIIVKNPDMKIGEFSFGVTDCSPKDVTYSEWFALYENACGSYFSHDDTGDLAWDEFNLHTKQHDLKAVDGAVIYVHDDGAKYSVEDYATQYEIPLTVCHFYDEWLYDYDNMIRTRKCKLCDKIETENLETTENDDVEIIEPVNPDTDFTVDVVEDYVIIEETISNNITTDFEIVKAFDINLKNKDGVHVQPDGTVKVKLPLDWSKDGVYKVYRVNDNGTLTDMNAYREGSHMVFDTDHFSIYVIVDESEKTDAPTTPDKPQEETKDNLFSKIIDLINSFFDLIASMFKR